MRKFVRWLVRISLVLFVLLGSAAFWKRDDLTRLYHVNTLFDEGNIVSNFSSMNDLFFNVDVKRSGPVTALADGKREIAQTYQWDGKTKSVQDWLDITKTTSLVVMRDGVIAHESYLMGTKPEDKRISWSMAKSFLSAMFGTAHRTDQNVNDMYLNNLTVAKKITV